MLKKEIELEMFGEDDGSFCLLPSLQLSPLETHLLGQLMRSCVHAHILHMISRRDDMWNVMDDFKAL